MNGTLLDSLPSASRISGNGDFSLIVKVLSSTGVHLADRFHQLLAERVALAPAFDRGDAIGGAHRLAVMPFQAVAQGEAVGQLVVAGRPAIDHLRLRLEVLVEREQRVEDQIAEIARDIGGRPDRVDAAQIGLRNEPQGLLRGLAPPNRQGRRRAKSAAAAANRKVWRERNHASLFGIIVPGELTRSIHGVDSAKPGPCCVTPSSAGERAPAYSGLQTRIDVRYAEHSKKALNRLAFFLF